MGGGGVRSEIVLCKVNSTQYRSSMCNARYGISYNRVHVTARLSRASPHVLRPSLSSLLHSFGAMVWMLSSRDSMSSKDAPYSA